MWGAERPTLHGATELRALAAILNAAVAALEVHDELHDFDDEAATMLAETQEPTATSRKRMPRHRKGGTGIGGARLAPERPASPRRAAPPTTTRNTGRGKYGRQN